MVTMWFIVISLYSNSSVEIPHDLPLFKDEQSCKVTAMHIEDAMGRNGKYTCLPIDVEGK